MVEEQLEWRLGQVRGIVECTQQEPVCVGLCLHEPVWQELSTTVLQNNSGKSVEAGQVH